MASSQPPIFYLIFSDHAWDDHLYWQKTDKKILRRINTLVSTPLFMKETKRNPFDGVGKPEPLKHALSRYWSRRINDEQCFIYKASEDAI